jgi:hypothetical protein
MNLPLRLIAHMSFMILMIILLIIGVIKARQKGSNWLKIHRGFAFAGLLSGVTGFLFMAIFKLLNDYSHFTSNHSKGGLIALILVLITPSLGMMLMKQKLKSKIVHKIFGVITLIFCLMAATFGFLKVFG